jgi:hypothetical protein
VSKNIVPLILSVQSQRSLSWSGGTVIVTTRVRNATFCRVIGVPGRQNAEVSAMWRNCRRGVFRVPITLASNKTPQPVYSSIKIVVRNGHVFTSRTIELVVEDDSSLASDNWAGYLLPALSPITTVSATWTVPTLDCNVPSVVTPNSASVHPWKDSYLYVWVGVDGKERSGPRQSKIFQDGSGSQCRNGQQVNYLWRESYPASPVAVSWTVNAGDTISAYVGEVRPGQWTWAVYDSTTEAGVSTAATPVSYSGSATEAAWIVEDPGNPRAPFPGRFTPITFRDISVQPVSALSNKAAEPQISSGSEMLATTSVRTNGAGDVTLVTVTHDG